MSRIGVYERRMSRMGRGIRLMGLGHTELMAGLLASVQTVTEEDDKMSGLNGIKLSLGWVWMTLRRAGHVPCRRPLAEDPYYYFTEEGSGGVKFSSHRGHFFYKKCNGLKLWVS
jgi:hypothetical protein